MAIEHEIWNAAVAGTREGATPSAPRLLLPALNAMFDIATTRAVARTTHPPTIIFVMLAVLAYIGSFLAGYGMAGGKAQLDSHDRLRRDRCRRSVCHHRPRISAFRIHPNRRRGSNARRTSAKYEVMPLRLRRGNDAPKIN